MSEQPDRAGEPEPLRSYSLFGRQRMSRQERIRRDLARDRNSRVPTWVYAAALAAAVLAWIAVIVLY
jgi:hypothetical protein